LVAVPFVDVLAFKNSRKALVAFRREATLPFGRDRGHDERLLNRGA
jgi:hypothetical protein